MGRVQKELDLAIERAERLAEEDQYEQATTNERPSPVTTEEGIDPRPLYIETQEKVKKL